MDAGDKGDREDGNGTMTMIGELLSRNKANIQVASFSSKLLDVDVLVS